MGISLATKGIICLPTDLTINQQFVLPLNVKINATQNKLTIKREPTLKLNIKKISG